MRTGAHKSIECHNHHEFAGEDRIGSAQIDRRPLESKRQLDADNHNQRKSTFDFIGRAQQCDSFRPQLENFPVR